MSREVLSIQDLCLTFHGRGDDVPAVRGVSLRIDAGETVALVGESGSGKTALVREILKLHAAHTSVTGSIRLLGRDILKEDERTMQSIRGSECAMVFQDPAVYLDPSCRIGDQIAEVILLHEKVSRDEALKRAEDLLESMGIENAAEKMKLYPFQFSGGMLQRAAIASAMACGPRLLIADEPTTALDRDSQGLVIDVLKRIAADPERAVLFVSHDLSVVRNIADRIMVMKDGRIIEQGETEQVFLHPQEEYTKRLILYSEYGKGTAHYHGLTHFHHGEIHAHPGGAPHSHSNGEMPAEQGNTAEQAEQKKDAQSVVRIRDLSKSYKNGRHMSDVYEHFDMDIYQGEVLGVAGPSGGGKSTLAQMIIGLEKPTGGTIDIKPGLRMSLIFQDSAAAFDPRMRIRDIIAEPLVIRGGMKRQDIRSRVLEEMDHVVLSRDLADRFPYELSGGERQRAAIARALITAPDLLIADEPIASLDVSIQAEIIHLLRSIHDETGMTMMIISHDLPMIAHISDRIIRIGQPAEAH